MLIEHVYYKGSKTIVFRENEKQVFKAMVGWNKVKLILDNAAEFTKYLKEHSNENV